MISILILNKNYIENDFKKELIELKKKSENNKREIDFFDYVSPEKKLLDELIREGKTINEMEIKMSKKDDDVNKIQNNPIPNKKNNTITKQNNNNLNNNVNNNISNNNKNTLNNNKKNYSTMNTTATGKNIKVPSGTKANSKNNTNTKTGKKEEKEKKKRNNSER